ncbi:transmembrane protein [Mycobacterium tuberculosis]|nr:transmembrane protein [Mycobacterium tuberculosis]
MTARCTRRFGLLLWPLSSGRFPHYGSVVGQHVQRRRHRGLRPAPADPAGAGGPLILCAAGLWAFLRTYRVWRAEGTWWGWHGAGWFLLTLMVLTLCIGVPPIAGPVMAP